MIRFFTAALAMVAATANAAGPSPDFMNRQIVLEIGSDHLGDMSVGQYVEAVASVAGTSADALSEHWTIDGRVHRLEVKLPGDTLSLLFIEDRSGLAGENAVWLFQVRRNDSGEIESGYAYTEDSLVPLYDGPEDSPLWALAKPTHYGFNPTYVVQGQLSCGSEYCWLVGEGAPESNLSRPDIETIHQACGLDPCLVTILPEPGGNFSVDFARLAE